MVEYNIEKLGGNTYLSRERKLLFEIKKRKVKNYIYIRWTRALSTISRASPKLRKYVFTIQNMESGRHSTYIYLKINSEFHARKNPKQ